MRNAMRSLLTGLLLLSLGASAAWGSVTGSISGTVKDPAGAVIPGAIVTATNIQNGVRQQVVSSAEGAYSFLALQAGHYVISAEHKGFDRFKSSEIVLDVNAELRLPIVLRVGSVSQTVSVSGTVPQVQTESTQMGDVIESKKMEATPLNGRSYIDLLGLQPGVVPISSGSIGGDRPVSGNLSAGNVSVSGQRESANGFMVNGGSVEEGRNNGAAIVPNLDSIAEFRLLTNSFDAEYGHFSGGLINAITKSGTNGFHGSAFEFLRNEHLDARNFYDPSRGKFSRNQFGGTFGGPLVRNKLFFFGDYQGTRETRGVSTGNVLVPDAGARQGVIANPQSNLTGAVNGGYWANILSQRLGYAVSSGEPYYTAGCTTSAQCVFPNGIVPQSAWDGPASHLMQYIPTANAGQYFTSAAGNAMLHDNKGSVRVDADSSRYGTLSAYYFIDNSNFLNPYAVATVPGFETLTPGRAQQLNLSDTKAFGATAVNEFRFNFMRDANIFNEPQGGVGPKLGSLGFQEGPSTLIPVVPKLEGVPLVSFNNFTIGLPDGTTGQYNNTFEWLDNFSKVSGSHTIKLGGEYHYVQINERNTYAENGDFGFSGAETGSDWADFLIGAPDYFIQSSQQFLDSRTNYAGLYAQDSWHVTNNLTVNYGLRWEVSQPWYDTQNKIETLVPGMQSKVFPGAPTGWVFPGDPGIPSTLAPTRYNNFGPRVGLAYSPGAASGLGKALFGGPGRSSIRASYGLFYTSVEDLTMFIEVGDAPYGLFYFSPAPPTMSTPYIDRATGNNEGQRFPFTPPKPGQTNIDWSQFLPISSAPGYKTTNRLPYAEHYELSFERQFGAHTLMNFSYVGTQGHRLIAQLESNPGDPALCLSVSQPGEVTPGGATCGPFGENGVYTTASGQVINGTRSPFGNNFGSNAYLATMANSAYNALESSLRYTTGSLSFLAGYTYSRSLDNASGMGDWINPLNYRLSRSLSSFDMAHNFVFSYSWTLPFARLTGHRNNLTDGWTLTGVTHLTTGLPISIRETNDNSLLGTSGVDEPNFAGGNLNVQDPRTNQPYFNVALFSPEALGTIGNANRRFFHGPGLENFDMAMLKNISLGESRSIQLRAEFFNVFNHAQFQNPTGNINSSSFGIVTGARDPRIGQLAVKFTF